MTLENIVYACYKVKKIIDNITCPIWICGGSGVVEGWLGSGTERGEPFKSQKGGNAMLEEIIRKWGGHEVSAMQVYTDLFGLGEGLIQRQDEEPGAFKSNPLGYWKNDGEQRGHRRILFDDTFEETLKEMQEADFSIMNGLTYFGKRNAAENASKMYAMIFDVDGITDETLIVVNNRLSVMCDENHMIGKTVNTMLSPVVPVFLYFVLLVFVDIILICSHNSTSLVLK